MPLATAKAAPKLSLQNQWNGVAALCVRSGEMFLQKVKTYPWAAGSLATEYSTQYPPKAAPKTWRQANYLQLRNQCKSADVPFDGTTMQRSDFQGLKGTPAEPIRPQPQQYRERKLDGATTYRIAHTAKAAQPSRVKNFCQLRAKTVDTNDYGFDGMSTVKADYKDWKGARPSSPAKFPQSDMPPRTFDGTTDYSANFINKHSGVPAVVHMHAAVVGGPPLRGCTMYAKEYTPKPIPPRAAACGDRPWMNCDSCKPSVAPTPKEGEGCGLDEKAWTQPPFATGRAVLDDRTMHKTTYRHWAGGLVGQH